ncbi:porin family protein [Kaustia mangrovi]|uniref:Porin family protein n=1 Tax=Kaustia mangrovi TaxID=2593653 RepID=A0A7S8HCR6_9HYPH|nr:outer membrane beta-barrel protein [Kaustia mangrovi]QPC43906.1 porin family protein [Kaustia mangrovi]
MTKTFKSLALGSVAAAALVSASMMSNKAEAADLYVAPPPPPPPVMTWTGPYIGGFVGGGAHNATPKAEFDGDDIKLDGVGGDGFMFGGFVGYNFQVSPQFVLGIQGDINVPDFDTKLSGSIPIDAKFDNDIVWSVSARAGWLPSDNTMLYVIGGWSNTEYTFKVSGGGDSFKQDETYNGWHIGAGIETKLTESITARVEYRYTDFGKETWFNEDGLAIKISPVTHTGMVGIAYNFGGLFY